MKLPNSYYQKIAAEWFRKNLTKPNQQAFDIQNDDLYLIEADRSNGSMEFRGIVYGEHYSIKFFRTVEEKKAKMLIQKLTIMTDEIVEVKR